jgi:hypothetical protein
MVTAGKGRYLKTSRVLAIVAWISTFLMSLGTGLAIPSLLWAESYPAVRPLRRTFSISDVSKANVSLDIETVGGAPVYHLQCHSAGYAGDPEFDYSGDFECRLSLTGQPNSYSTLLTEDARQSRDWESRGRFFAAQLGGSCAPIPEFGASRSFELRGMDLDLRITAPRFAEAGKLKSLRLTVTVRPDPVARQPIAAIVHFPPVETVPESCNIRKDFVDYSTFGSPK